MTDPATSDSLKPMISTVGLTHLPTKWHHYVVKKEKDIFDIRLQGSIGSHTWNVVVNHQVYDIVTPYFEFFRRRLRLTINRENEYFRLQYLENFIWTAYCGITSTFVIYTQREWELAQFMPAQKKNVLESFLASPMPGLIVDIKVKTGNRGYRGQGLVIIESMKMESGVASPHDGKVSAFNLRGIDGTLRKKEGHPSVSPSLLIDR